VKALAAGVALHLAIAAAGAATIAGHVSGAKGEAVSGATVVAYGCESQEDAADRMMAGTKRAVLAKTTADAKGAFALDVPIRGIFVLGVESAGFAPSFVECDSEDANANVALVPAALRDGSVTGPAGPVAGARVIATGQFGDVEVRTGADGRFRLPDPRKWALGMYVIHPDYAPAMSMAQTPDVTLARGTSIAGKVVDAKGNAVAGARIRLGRLPRAVSAAHGTFTIAHALLPAREITAETSDLFGKATAASNVTIRVKPSLSVSGTVRDGQRNPVAGVSVTATSDEEPRMSVTDDKGVYALRHLLPGSWQLGAGNDVWTSGEESHLDVKKSMTHDLTVTRIPELTGKVQLEDGSPAADAAITVTYVENDMRMYSMHGGYTISSPTRSDANGRFHLRLPESEIPLVVTAARPGLPPARSETIMLKSGSPRPSLTLTIPKGIEVRGSVVDAAGRSLAGVALAPQLNERSTVMGNATEWAASDADGRFSVRLPTAEWGLRFSKEGFLDQSVPRAGNAALKVMLQPAVEIRGRVTRKDGTPVADVIVAVNSEDRSAFSQTQADGTFVITGVPKGPTTLRYLIRAGASGTTSVTAPASDVHIVLGGQGTVRGRVVDGSGAPVSSFSVMVEPVQRNFEEFSMPRQIASDDGRFEVTDAPLGAVTLSIVAHGFLKLSRSLTLTESESADAGTLVVSSGRTVRGVVSSPGGEPLGGVDVAVSRSDDSTAGSVTSNDDGTYELGSVSLTAATISFSKRGFVRADRQIAAGSGDQSLNVQLAPGRVVAGRVLSADGKPVPNANVTANSAAYGAEYETQRSDANGAFRFDSLIAARYDFTAKDEKTQLSGAVTDVDVASAGEITIRLQPASRATIVGQVTGIDAASVMMAQVEASVAGEDRSATAPIDRNGNYRIENAPAGTVTVQAMAGGRRGFRRSSSVTVDVSPNSEARADLSFPPQIEVHGRVSLRGEPLPGASLRFGSDATGDGVSVTSVDGGAFETLLAPGPYQISIEASPLHGSYEIEREIRAGSSVDIDITTASVAVTVIDSSGGTPVAGAKVSTQDTPSPTHTTDRGLTDAAGQLAFDVAAPPARIFVEKNDYATASVDGQTSPVVVKLTRSEGAVVRLIDARDGRTLSGYVIARDDAGHVLASGDESGADGAMRLAILPGTYRFSASASEYGSNTVTAEVPAAEVHIPLRRGGKLLLRSNVDLRAYARLIQSDGEEYVRCWCSGIAEIRITGRATVVDSIAPGTYTLEVTPDGSKPRTYPVSVIEGQTVTVAMQ
jgi:protocatechuate 3,4-dioxygenase beta subunit